MNVAATDSIVAETPDAATDNLAQRLEADT